MLLEVVWTRRAESQLQHIFSKLDEYSPGIAESWLAEIDNRTGLLARFPAMANGVTHAVSMLEAPPRPRFVLRGGRAAAHYLRHFPSQYESFIHPPPLGRCGLDVSG